MKKYIQVLFILISLSVSTQSAAVSKLHDNIVLEPEQKIIKIHNAINSAALRIRLDENLHGFVVSKNCSFCKTIKITITPDTKAYRNNVNVPLEQAKHRNGRFATINYNIKTNNVSAIRW